MSTNKDNPQWDVEIHISRCFKYDDVLKYVLYNFFEKASYKKSQLEKSEIKIIIQEFINICTDVPFQIDEFDNETLGFPINLDLFEKLDPNYVANRPFFASLFFVLDKAMFLERMWEIQVIDKDNNSHVFGILCRNSYIKYGIEIFNWESSDQYFNIKVYFDNNNPKIIKSEDYNKILVSHGYKETIVVIKSSILGIEELECFKDYYGLIISICKKIDEPNLS